MKKMNLKKMLTMAMAAMMVMTTMSSVSAEETMGMMEDKVTIFTYNQDTKSFDVEYKDADEVESPQTRVIDFTFSQNITSSFSTLINTNPYVFDNNNTLFQLQGGCTYICVELTSYDSNSVYYYTLRNETDGVSTITSASLRTPKAYISGLEQVDAYSMKLKKTGSSYITSGKIYSTN